MIDSDILYIKKSNRSTLIYLKNNQEILVNQVFENVLNEYCIKDLTTLDGRIKATSKVFHIKKHIPIYLSKHLVLIPTKNKKEIDNIYINCRNVIDIIKDDQITKILFSDFSSIIVNQEYHLLKRYINKGLSIHKLDESL